MNVKEYWKRKAEISALDRRGNIKDIDPYVDYDLEIATENYKMGFFAVTSFYCAVALEDQLSAIYKVITDGDKERLFKVTKRNGSIDKIELEDMTFGSFKDWIIQDGNIIDATFNFKKIEAIHLLRNFFGHSARSMCEKTEKKIKEKKLDEILPTEIMVSTAIEEIIKYFEKSTGEHIDLKTPTNGWLYNDRTAINEYGATMELIEKFSQKFPSS